MARRRLLTILASLGAAVAMSAAPAVAQVDGLLDDTVDAVEKTVDNTTETVEDTAASLTGDNGDPAADESESDESDDVVPDTDTPLDPVVDEVEKVVDDVEKAVEDSLGDDPAPGDDDGPVSELTPPSDDGDDSDRSDDRDGTDDDGSDDRADERAGSSDDGADDRDHPGYFEMVGSGGLTLGDLQRRFGESTVPGLGSGRPAFPSFPAPEVADADLARLTSPQDPDVAPPAETTDGAVAEPDADETELAMRASTAAPIRAVDSPALLQALAAMLIVGTGVVWKMARDEVKVSAR